MNLPTIALTPEQAALTPIYREKWRQIGLSIALLDRPIATAAIHTTTSSAVGNRKLFSATALTQLWKQFKRSG